MDSLAQLDISEKTGGISRTRGMLSHPTRGITQTIHASDVGRA